jgi:hypothetical protein
MSKPIVLGKSQWEKIYAEIKQDYPLSTVLIRSRMRETLGFSLREHSEWTPPNGNDYYGHHSVTMRLDFYDEPKRLMFLLKYGEFLEKNKLEGIVE